MELIIARGDFVVVAASTPRMSHDAVIICLLLVTLTTHTLYFTISKNMENISKKPRLAQETFINDLPDEMLLSIFEYLSMHELVKYSKTCLQWRDIIAQFILRTKILRLAKTNGLFKREIQQEGWTEEAQDSDFIMSLYPKYEFRASKLHFSILHEIQKTNV